MIKSPPYRFFSPLYFFGVTKGPRNDERIIAGPKCANTEFLNFFRNGFIIFMIFHNISKLQKFISEVFVEFDT